MPKLKLEIDTLRVDSFATPAPEAVPGTVQAHAQVQPAAHLGTLIYNCFFTQQASCTC